MLFIVIGRALSPDKKKVETWYSEALIMSRVNQSISPNLLPTFYWFSNESKSYRGNWNRNCFCYTVPQGVLGLKGMHTSKTHLRYKLYESSDAVCLILKHWEAKLYWANLWAMFWPLAFPSLTWLSSWEVLFLRGLCRFNNWYPKPILLQAMCSRHNV